MSCGQGWGVEVGGGTNHSNPGDHPLSYLWSFNFLCSEFGVVFSTKGMIMTLCNGNF